MECVSIPDSEHFGVLCAFVVGEVKISFVSLYLIDPKKPQHKNFIMILVKIFISFYFITSSEFNAYQMWVKLVFFYSEKISYFFTSD